MKAPSIHRTQYDPASDTFKKEEFPFFWLAQAHGKYTQRMEKALKKIDLDIPSWRVLFILKVYGESNISEISNHAITKLPTTTRIIWRMKEDGLVETAANPDDGRVTQVRLTPRGREMFEQMIEVTSDLFRQSFKGLSQAQIKRLNKLLETLFINLSDE